MKKQDNCTNKNSQTQTTVLWVQEGKGGGMGGSKGKGSQILLTKKCDFGQ